MNLPVVFRAAGLGLLLSALVCGCGNKADLVMPEAARTPAAKGQPTGPEALPPAHGRPADEGAANDPQGG